MRSKDIMRVLEGLWNSRLLQGAVLLAAVVASVGSASRPAPAPEPVEQLNYVASVVVGTEGVVITAADKSFALAAGQTAKTPFYCGGGVDVSSDGYTSARAKKGQRVTVQVPGMDQPLHGVLCFWPVDASVTGPASRSYLVQVPPEYVTATDGGRVSVVFEKASSPAGLVNYAWALWLSRTPL